MSIEKWIFVLRSDGGNYTDIFRLTENEFHNLHFPRNKAHLKVGIGTFQNRPPRSFLNTESASSCERRVINHTNVFTSRWLWILDFTNFFNFSANGRSICRLVFFWLSFFLIVMTKHDHDRNNSWTWKSSLLFRLSFALLLTSKFSSLKKPKI